MALARLKDVRDASLSRLDLSALACDAAIEIDQLMRRETPTLDAVSRLSHRLFSSVANVPELSSLKSFLRPANAVILSRAIADSNVQVAPIDSVADLVKATDEIQKQLKSLVDNPSGAVARDIEKLTLMRGFCLALSRRVASQRRSTTERLPSHPFRK